MIISKRTSQRLFRFAVDEFIRILSEVQKRKINYRCNNNDTKAWNEWVEEFESRNYVIGEDFVKTYVLWGIQTWMNPDSNTDRKYNYTMRFNWIFGKGGIKRWNANDLQTNRRFIRQYLKQDFTLSSNAKTRIGEIVLLIRPAEELQRQRYFNTKRGLAWCIATTYLYHHRSNFCVACNFKDECKMILKESYPKIYKARGYNV